MNKKKAPERERIVIIQIVLMVLVTALLTFNIVRYHQYQDYQEKYLAQQKEQTEAWERLAYQWELRNLKIVKSQRDSR